MPSATTVDLADRYSRKRAMIVAAAALAFIIIHVIFRPLAFGGPDSARHANTEIMWAINAVVLLACLATGGGILNSRQIRSLVNDEVAQSNYRSAVVAGYWVAMTTAMGLYVIPGFARITGRDAVWAIVTAGISVALLTFSYLEYRAHRDA